MSQYARPEMTMPLSFSERETMGLARLLVAIAKEERITEDQRRLAAELFIRMDNTVKANRPIKPALTPIRYTKSKRR